MSSDSKMDPELKQKWIAALKSGEYKQGKSCLHDVEQDTYCCLGVLNEVAGYGYHSTDGILGTELDQRVQIQLIHMNDFLDYSFEGIANWIEENL